MRYLPQANLDRFQPAGTYAGYIDVAPNAPLFSGIALIVRDLAINV